MKKLFLNLITSRLGHFLTAPVFFSVSGFGILPTIAPSFRKGSYLRVWEHHLSFLLVNLFLIFNLNQL
jgi:hypothetical protein